MNTPKSRRSFVIAGQVTFVLAWALLLVIPGPFSRYLQHLPLEPSVPWVAAPQPVHGELRCLRSSVPGLVVCLLTAVALQVVALFGAVLIALGRRLSPLVLAVNIVFQFALLNDTLRVLARDWHLLFLSYLHLFTLSLEDTGAFPLSEPRYPVLSGVVLVVLLFACSRASTERSA